MFAHVWVSFSHPAVNHFIKKINKKFRENMLTLNVNSDTGLPAVGHCFVRGLADDLLTRLDVGR